MVLVLHISFLSDLTKCDSAVCNGDFFYMIVTFEMKFIQSHYRYIPRL